MRKLSFETFLKNYLSDVSGKKSVSIHYMSELSKDNVRVIDPLVLYCLYKNKMNIFFKYFKDDKYSDLKSLTKSNYLDASYSHYSFQKIRQSYERKASTPLYDNQTKSLIRDNIIKIMREKNISNYRVYTDLKLNPGNVNDYLTNGNSNKVSLELVKKIYNYCVTK